MWMFVGRQPAIPNGHHLEGIELRILLVLGSVLDLV